MCNDAHLQNNGDFHGGDRFHTRVKKTVSWIGTNIKTQTSIDKFGYIKTSDIDLPLIGVHDLMRNGGVEIPCEYLHLTVEQI